MLMKPIRPGIGIALLATATLMLTSGAAFDSTGEASYAVAGQAEQAAAHRPDPASVTVTPAIRSLVPEVTLDPPRLETSEGVNTSTDERVSMRQLILKVHDRAPLGIRLILFGWGDSGYGTGENKAGSPNVIGPYGEYEVIFSADEFQAGDVLELRAVVFADGTTSGSKAAIRNESPDAIAEDRAKPPLDPRCPGGGAYANGCCRAPSAIIIDVAGDGLAMTDSEGGVLFDMSADGTVDRTAWTTSGSDDAWLCLDRNGNGKIDDATELFGSITHQPAARDATGFLALRALDTNDDGAITRLDDEYATLRLWIDANHDGVSQAEELSSPSEKGVDELSLEYEEHQVFDANSNCHRLRAIVRVGPDRTKTMAWEVIPTMDYGWT